MVDFETSILNTNENISSIWYSPKYGEKLTPPKDEFSAKINGYDKDGVFHPFISKSNGKIVIAPGSLYDEKLS